MSAPNPYNRRFVLFTGKGGVGKTTVASAFAYSCANAGERTLLIEINSQDKVSSMFGSAHVGTEITEIEDNLYAVNCTPASAMEEYALMMLRVRIVYKAVFENRIIQSFLAAIPGLNELVMLGKAYYHAIEKENDRYVWDKVVVDMPATGHGLFFLQIPEVITSILSSGHMFDEAQNILRVLTDETFTMLNIVTLPEEMPVNETKMLYESAQEKLGVALGFVVANGIYPRRFTAEEIALLDNPQDDHQRAVFAAARFRHARCELQQRYLKELYTATPLPVAEFPYVFTDKVDFRVIKAMSTSLREQFLSGGRRV